jgi:hypothetical protein
LSIFDGDEKRQKFAFKSKNEKIEKIEKILIDVVNGSRSTQKNFNKSLLSFFFDVETLMSCNVLFLVLKSTKENV